MKAGFLRFDMARDPIRTQWYLKPTEAEYSLLLTRDQVREFSVDEINDRIVQAFQYDDFAWQKERGIRTPYPGRAEGLHKVLYQCPCCKTEFSHIPDWYEWERSNVREEVESGSYNTGVMPVKVYSLPNARRFIHLGEGTMVQDGCGFHVHFISTIGA